MKLHNMYSTPQDAEKDLNDLSGVFQTMDIADVSVRKI